MPVSRLLNRVVLAAYRWAEHQGAVRPGTDLADEFGAFGHASLLGHPWATLYGQSKMHIGSGTLIGKWCALAVGYGPEDHHAPDRGLVIGDRCVIGARSTITAHGSITIGDDVWFGQSVFVSDSGHGYQDPETPIGVQLDHFHPVSIGSGSWIGHGAIILPGATIGRNVVVGAGSVVRGEVPDHTIVAGVPARVVRRLVPGKGWVSASKPDDVKPAWTAAEVAALYADEG
ncbi:MAG TPA: acyltransferase [Marmoricola sp.]|nr:acyltransferase [Marmoricola sp.]